MTRYCFSLQVRPERLHEYAERHSRVWPEMLQALEQAGWGAYSLFLREDGLLIGTLECDDLDAARAAMARTDVNRRWQAEMAEFFAGTDNQAPDEALVLLTEVFHLPTALAAARTAQELEQAAGEPPEGGE